jgi:hypothetical protein
LYVCFTHYLRIFWIAISSIDTKDVSRIVTNLVKRRFTILADKFRVVVCDCFGTITEELIVSVQIQQPRNAFSSMITLMSLSARLVLVIAHDTRPTGGTRTMHTIPIVEFNRMARKVGLADDARGINGAIQSTFLSRSSGSSGYQ